MDISLIHENCLYFVSNDFFDLVKDDCLKKNKETTLRPHYFPFKDDATGLFWLIPCSSQVEKYEKIIESKKRKHKPHNHIQIVTISGKKQAFLYQDMFPILPEYIDKPYISKSGPYELKDPKKIKEINENATKIIRLLRHGICFTDKQPNIIKIEKLLLEKRKS